MAVVYNQLASYNLNLPGYAVAKELAKQTIARFGAVRGLSLGIGDGSCCAALAVVPTPSIQATGSQDGFTPLDYQHAYPLPKYTSILLPFAVVYGNAQMASGGLVSEHIGGHAERAALTAAGGTPLYFDSPNNATLFAELEPCFSCKKWLEGSGGGVENPYNTLFNNGVTLNVWYLWPYPCDGSVAKMNNFHGSDLQSQVDAIKKYC